LKPSLVQALIAFGAMTMLLGEARAQSIDPCLLGTWEATAVTLMSPGGQAVTGGSGFRVTFKPDGTETVDYAAMSPFKWPPNQFGMGDTQPWRGTAAVRISTDRQVAKLEAILQTSVEYNPSELVLRQYMPGGLGPGTLGSTGTDNGYFCTNESLEYKASSGPRSPLGYSVKLARVKDGAKPLSADAGPAVEVHGRTWLTVTEIKDRTQDVEGVWLDTSDAGPDQLTWIAPPSADQLSNHPVHQRDSDLGYLDMKQRRGQRWDGRVYICPQPKARVPIYAGGCPARSSSMPTTCPRASIGTTRSPSPIAAA
jgi:hypothetical protein